MTIEAVMTVLSPFIVWLAIKAADVLTGKMKGLVPIIAIPFLSLALMWITSLFTGEVWWYQFGVSFGSVFLNELITRLKGTTKPTA